MPFIGGPVVIEEIDAVHWRLVHPLRYRGRTEEFTVPAGFETDLASVPRPVVWLVPRYGVYTKAAILHDHLLVSGAVHVADADGLFRRCLRELGVRGPRRWLMWAGVRFHHRLRGATPGAILGFLGIAAPAVLYLALPVAVVTVAILIFWLVELIAWSVLRLLRRTDQGPPGPQLTT